MQQLRRTSLAFLRSPGLGSLSSAAWNCSGRSRRRASVHTMRFPHALAKA